MKVNPYEISSEESGFESMLRIILTDDLQRLAMETPEYEGELPPKVGDELDMLVKKKWKSDRKVARRAGRPRRLAAAAVIALVLLSGSMVLYGTVEAFRARVDNFFFSFNEEYSEYKVYSNTSFSLPDGVEFAYLITKLPEGTSIIDSNIKVNSGEILYESDETQITFKYHILSNTTVHAAGKEVDKDKFNTKVHDFPATLTTDGDNVVLTWRTSDATFFVLSNGDIDTVMSAAESVILFQ